MNPNVLGIGADDEFELSEQPALQGDGRCCGSCGCWTARAVEAIERARDMYLWARALCAHALVCARFAHCVCTDKGSRDRLFDEMDALLVTARVVDAADAVQVRWLATFVDACSNAHTHS